MAAGPNITLRRILSQPKPIVPRKTKSNKNTKARPEWPGITAQTIKVWDDFNLDNLNESYGHILDLPIPGKGLAVPDPSEVLSTIEIVKPDHIRHLIGWNDKALRPTLDFAKTYLNLYNGVRLYHRTSTADGSAIARIPGAARIQVDHLVALDEYPVANLVVGIGRPSSKFQGRKLASRPENANIENVLPLRQLANLCMIAKTRYGYIQTEEDLLVCRFSKYQKDLWKVALMPIPWSRHGENQLTTELALWWLSMLAMSATQHHTIVEEKEMTRINDWELSKRDDGRGWVRRHKYSNFEEPADPPPLPVYQFPSPGNVAGQYAAFATQVGIHADPLFDFTAVAGDNPGDISFDDDFFFNGNDSNVINPADPNTTNTERGQADS